MRIVLSIVTAVASWLHLQNTEREEESERVIRVSKVYLNYLCITIFDIDEIKKWALQQKSKNYNTIVQVRHKTELDSQAVRGRVTTCNLCQTVLSGCYRASDMFFAGCCAYRITTCCYLAISARDGVFLARRHFTDRAWYWEWWDELMLRFETERMIVEISLHWYLCECAMERIFYMKHN